MSIIYDALQKTQRNREYSKLQHAIEQKTVKKLQAKPLSLVLFALFLSASTGALVSLYWHGAQTSQNNASHLWVTDASKAKPAAVQPMRTADAGGSPLLQAKTESGSASIESTPTPVVAQAAPSNPAGLTLNGVLISGLEKVALINNQPFHLGDIVQGMKIVEIDANQVKLQEGQSVLELKI